MNVAIIGGTRFIGPAIVAELRDRGHEVTLVHRGTHPSPSPVPTVHADRSDVPGLRAALASVAPDVVVHTCAMTQAHADAFVKAAPDVPVVVLSSQDVYAQFGRLNGLDGPPPEPLITEDSPKTDWFPFREVDGGHDDPDYSKQAVEARLAAAVTRGELPAATVLRCPMVYGPRDTARRFGPSLDALDEGATCLPRVATTGRITLAHVSDVAVAVALCLGVRSGMHVYNVGEAQAWSMARWVEDLAAAAGRPLTWEVTDDDDACGILGAFANDVVVSSAKLRAERGFTEVLPRPERLRSQVRSLRRTRFAEDDRPRLVCVEGLPGAGKTTTAQWVARTLSAAGRPSRVLHEGAVDPAVGLPWSYAEAASTVRRTTLRDYPFASWRNVPVDGVDTTVVDAKLLQNTSLFALLQELPRDHWLELPCRALHEVSGEVLVVLLDVSDPRTHLAATLEARSATHPEWHRFVRDFFTAQPYCRRRGWSGEEAFVGALADYWDWVREVWTQLPAHRFVLRDPADDWDAALEGLADVLAAERGDRSA